MVLRRLTLKKQGSGQDTAGGQCTIILGGEILGKYHVLGIWTSEKKDFE